MRKFGILCLGRKGWDHDISECCRGLHGGERFGALHEWCEKGTLAGWEWKGHSRSKIQIGTEIKWRETLVSWEKLTTEPFGGGVEGLSSNIGEHEAFCFHKQLSVCETDDNMVLKALKICFGNHTGALSLVSPFYTALSSHSPIFILKAQNQAKL